MKIVALGDTHGRTMWKQIVEIEKDADKIVFVGDYFDSHDNISGSLQIQNFENILQHKRDNPEQVVLLFGNHDYHYIVNEHYSGYNSMYASQYEQVIKKGISEDLLQMCYKVGEATFTHAGITKTWLENVGYYSKYNKKDLEEFINDLFKYKPIAFKFEGSSSYGDSVESSPIWVRPKSLMIDPPKEEITQIVGHTHQQLTTIDNHRKLKYAFVDSLEVISMNRKLSSYLVLGIEDGIIQEFEIKNL